MSCGVFGVLRGKQQLARLSWVAGNGLARNGSERAPFSFYLNPSLLRFGHAKTTGRLWFPRFP